MKRQKKDYLKAVSYKAQYAISFNGLNIRCNLIQKTSSRLDLYLGDHVVTSILKNKIKQLNYDFQSDDTIFLTLVML